MWNNHIIYFLILYLSSTMSFTTKFPETNKINIGMVVSLPLLTLVIIIMAGILIYKCKYDKNINVLNWKGIKCITTAFVPNKRMVRYFFFYYESIWMCFQIRILDLGFSKCCLLSNKLHTLNFTPTLMGSACVINVLFFSIT